MEICPRFFSDKNLKFYNFPSWNTFLLCVMLIILIILIIIIIIQIMPPRVAIFIAD